MTTDTVGKIAEELLKKTPESRDPIELQREAHKKFVKGVIECIEKNKKKISGDFFVVVLTKHERILKKVFRNYYGARKTCPTPDYDQTVYKYWASREDLEYIWTIPCREAVNHLKDNALEVAPEERQLLNFVLDFADGTLYKKCKILNNEEPDSNMLLN